MKKNVLTAFGAAVCASVVFCCGFSTAAVRADDAATDDGAFNVMSFNIRLGTGDDGDNRWDLRKETLVDVVKESAPLLLGVQEALQFQRDYLDEKLPEYASFGVGRDDGAQKGEAMAIYYKKDALELLDSGTFWLSKTPEKPGKGWDAACNRTVTWGKFRCKKTGKTFVYANTHLDHVGTIARKEGAKLILRQMTKFTDGGKYPFFVSGDFNVTEKSEAYKTITGGIDEIPGMFDTNKVAKVREIAQERTFHGWGSVPVEKAGIIDFIFVNDKLDVEKFKINPDKHSNGRFASDHCSIVATLKIKD